MLHNTITTPWILALMLCLACLAGCGAEESPETAQRAQPLEVVCVQEGEIQPDAELWMCGESRVVECEAAQTSGGRLYYQEEGPNACQGSLEVSDAGPYAPGTWQIEVYQDQEQVCQAELIVVDSQPPRGTPQTTTLWPANHKMTDFSVEDCVLVEDTCDEQVEVSFLWASSDEAVNAEGDGNSEPDIELGATWARVRAERQGGGDGRVYTFGWRAEDDSGNVSEGTCQVQVPHDQGQGAQAQDSGQAYRLEP